MVTDWPTGTDVVTIELHDRVAVITLNRPERRNAIHHEMFEPITRALGEFAARDDVGVVVVTGAGSAFCAGGDVTGEGGRPGVDRDDDARVADLLGDARVVQRLHEHPKLTIAALNGPAAGAGMSLALACDLRIAAASSRLIAAWIELAFPGDFGGAWFLTRLVGPSRAIELLASGASLDAERAATLGLVNRVVPDDEFPEAWRGWAQELAQRPTGAIAMVKANVRDASRLELADALGPESARQVAATRSPEHREARRAWLAARSGNR